MKKIFLMTCILLSCVLLKAQQYLTVQFASQSSVPVQQFDSVNNVFNFIGTDSISLTLHKYNVNTFSKKYPTVYLETHSKAAKLDRVYNINIAGDINNLYNDLIALKSPNISAFYLASPPVSLVAPNDYSQTAQYFPWCTETASTSAPLDLINALPAWNITEGNPSLVIGIVDYGFDTSHTDLKNKVLPSTYLYTTALTNSYHGTSVAGVAGAETNNGFGFASIGNKTSLKFFAIGTNNILIAAQNGCRVINCSFYSSCSYYQDEQDQLDIVYDNYHAVVVVSAGNSAGCGRESYFYPASYNHVISVTSVGHVFQPNTFFLQNCPAFTSCGGSQTVGYNWKDYHDKFSNSRSLCPNLLTSSGYTHNDKVDVCAPAFEVPIIFSNTTISNGVSNFGGSGTSYASPFVSGTSALILSVNPSLNPTDVEAILRCTSRDVYEIWENTYYLNKLGAGRIDAGKAVQLAQTWVPGSAPAQQATPTDIRWFEILSNGVNTIEVESTCSTNNNPSYCNIGYRLEVVAPNPSQTFKWLTFYAENSVGLVSNIRYGNSIYLSRGVDYPYINSSIGSIKACVRVNECIPSIYYAEDRASACMGDGCTYNCPADIYITGYYSTPLKESYTWVKSTGQTTISPVTSVKLDGSPIQGYVEFKPTTGADYLLAEPTATGEFIVQAYNGCDADAPPFAHTSTINEAVTDEQITADKLSVYPNPTNGLFYVECKNSISSIQVYNTQGILVLEKQMSNVKKVAQKIAIDLTNFPSGVYILRSKGENFNYKIVKI